MVGLLRKKKHFRKDIAENRLGSPPSMQLLRALKPSHWFSAHLHCGFAAVVEHPDDGPTGRGTAATQTTQATKFLGLDKCLPGRHYLQWVEFPDAEGDKVFSYDAEWLSILTRAPAPGAPSVATLSRPTPEEVERIRARFDGDLTIPENFEVTAPPHDPASSTGGAMPTALRDNPQTAALLRRLGIGGDAAAEMVAAIENPEALDVGSSDEDW